jgi:hypothetical protein
MSTQFEPFRFQPGGYITGGYVTGDFPLDEGEKLVDQFGYIRAVWSGGRLLRFPMWFSRYLPRIPGR